VDQLVNRSHEKFATIAFVALALVPAVTAAQATDLTGNWNAKFTMTRPDGTQQSITFTFHFTQKGKVLSGTIGPRQSGSGRSRRASSTGPRSPSRSSSRRARRNAHSR
jgi:hypothetical protein